MAKLYDEWHKFDDCWRYVSSKDGWVAVVFDSGKSYIHLVGYWPIELNLSSREVAMREIERALL